MAGNPDTVYGNATTQTRLQSETADNITWSRYTSPHSGDAHHPPLVSDALTRVAFTEITSPAPLHAILHQTTLQLEHVANEQKRLLLVIGRSRRLAVENHQLELKELMEQHGAVGSEVKKTIGDVATALVVSGCSAGLVVMQAANRSDD